MRGRRIASLAEVLGIGVGVLALGCGDPGRVRDAEDAGPPDAGPCGTASSGPSARRLVCPDPIAVTCDGVRTPVADDVLPTPALEDDACGDDEVLSTVTTLPGEGLTLGASAVSITAVTRRGGLLSCVTEVDVVDADPPVVSCDEEVRRQVRRAPEDEVEVVPPNRVFDRCDPSPTSSSEVVAEDEPGRFRIVHEATDSSGNVGTCVTPVTVLDAFPAPRFRVMGGALREDGGTDVYLAWEDPGGDATELALERGPAPAGPFERIEVLPATQRTYVDADIPGDRAHYRLVTVADGLDGGVTAVVTAHAIDGQTYDLRNVPVTGIPFDTTLYGVTRYPTQLDDAAHPLVLLLHGNHGNCRATPDSETDFCSQNTDHVCPFAGFVTTPNAEGLGWLAESLAVQGRVAVTISGNAMNCRSNFNPERAALLVGHLRQWVTWGTVPAGAAPFGNRFVGKVDLGRVGLLGHSRGGEGVALVPALLEGSPVPGVSVRSVFALAPVDFEDPNLAGTPYAVLLPTCDGDVWTLTGMNVYDRTLPENGGAPLVQVVFDGAVHNFFNTEWFFDDSFSRFSRCDPPTRVSGADHRAGLEAVVGDWFAATVDAATGDGAGVLPAWLRGEGAVPESVDVWAGDPDLRRSHASAGTILVDDFRLAAAPDENLLGEANRLEGLAETEVCAPFGCGGQYRHLRPALSARWDVASTAVTDPVVAFGLGVRDTADVAWLAFRVASRDDALNDDGRTRQGIAMTVVDAGGTSERVVVTDLPEAQPVPHLYPATNPFELYVTVRVPTTAFPTVDTTRISSIVLSPTAAEGALLITDVALEPAD